MDDKELRRLAHIALLWLWDAYGFDHNDVFKKLRNGKLPEDDLLEALKNSQLLWADEEKLKEALDDESSESIHCDKCDTKHDLNRGCHDE